MMLLLIKFSGVTTRVGVRIALGEALQGVLTPNIVEDAFQHNTEHCDTNRPRSKTRRNKK